MMHAVTSLVRKLAVHSFLEPEEMRALGNAFGRPQVYRPRQELKFDGEAGRLAFLLEEGWAFTYKILPNGSRQVVDIAIAGDIVGIRGLLLRNSDLAGAMVTAGVVHDVSRHALEVLVRDAPRAAAALLWSCSRDESLVVEHLVDVGRRTALQRVAHFLLELKQRLRLVALAGEGPFRCPLSQLLIADALGLTPIHLNRTIRELKRRNLVAWRSGTIQLTRERELAELAGYDPSYLDIPTVASEPGSQAAR